MLFARHPLYGALPIVRTTEILDAVRRQHNFCMLDGGRLTGAILWKPVPDEAARRAIDAGRMPSPSEVHPEGMARVATCFIAPAPEQVRAFWEAFVGSQSGRIVLYERHTPGKSPRLQWVDRSGRRKGKQL